VPDDELGTHDCNCWWQQACAAESCRPADDVVLCSVELLIRVPDNGVEHAPWPPLIARGWCSWKLHARQWRWCFAVWRCTKVHSAQRSRYVSLARRGQATAAVQPNRAIFMIQHRGYANGRRDGSLWSPRSVAGCIVVQLHGAKGRRRQVLAGLSPQSG